MSNSVLTTLLELFPTISEEFLSGIYDAHKDEQVTVEEIVEVVLSFEYPPLRENANKHILDLSNSDSNGLIEVKLEPESEVPSLINGVNVGQQVENEVLQKSISNINGGLVTENEDFLLKKVCDDRQNHGVNTPSRDVLDEELSDENKKANGCHGDICETRIGPDSNNESEGTATSTVNKLHSSQMNKPIIETNYLTCSASHESSKEEENYDNDDDDDDSSPECSIKYLMKEDVMDRCSITTHMKKLEEKSEENRELALCESIQNKHSSLSPASSSLTLASSGHESSDMKQKKVCRVRKRSTRSNWSQSSSSQALPHCSHKRMTLRSCKVKNEEERLRRKLIDQRKFLHKRVEKTTNSVHCSSQFLDSGSKYALLCKVFTDANPAYLLDHCELLTDQEQILDFISKNLELRDYPKIESLKETLMETFHCTTAEFLEVISDPVAEFSSPNYVRAGYEGNAEIYLKARYQGLGDEEMKGLLKAANYNLTSVCEQLEQEGRIPIPGVLDYTPLHHPASVFFHQEVWYIENSKEVREYMDSAIEAIRIQEELDRPPTPPEEVFECEICREEIVEYSELGTCDGQGGHLFCINCIKRSVEVKMGDGGTAFPCLVNCGAFIPLQTVKELLPTNVFDKLMWRIQEEEIRKANIAGVETCPFCPFAYGPGEERLFICLNPHCMKLSCRICRKDDHSPELCEIFKEEDEERARLMIENKMAEALMRTCYSCGKNFVKSTGCNKMECTCGAKMCYVCRQPVQDYSHFNGQGGDNLDRCPLFSNDNDLHDRPVEATAQQVFNEIAANNPQLHLDPTKIIPK